MKVFRYPERKEWGKILVRPAVDTRREEEAVRTIIDEVKTYGDAALKTFTEKFDGVGIDDLRVSEEEFAEAEQRVPAELKAAINTAKTNIEKFHEDQREEIQKIETTPGVVCWRKSVAIEKVGLYVPAGSAPLFSTVLMLAIPANIAGCKDIILCSPPDKEGRIAEAILYSARLCGVTDVFKVGGAQSIAAMAYGTESIPRVYKIFGPGNRWVTTAKQTVSQRQVAIDMPAGPSEVAVFADETCEPEFVAADLLSQAEHGADSQVILVSTSSQVIEKVLAEIETQVAKLPRAEIAKKALENSSAILVKDVTTGIEMLNEYAPEHLVMAIEDVENVADKVTNAGSVFLGNYACESAGDYASGTNHTLPTAGFATAFGGVSLDSFVKKITFQNLSEDGLKNLGPAIETMAAAEGLNAHKEAVSIRLRKINGV